MSVIKPLIKSKNSERSSNPVPGETDPLLNLCNCLKIWNQDWSMKDRPHWEWNRIHWMRMPICMIWWPIEWSLCRIHMWETDGVSIRRMISHTVWWIHWRIYLTPCAHWNSKPDGRCTTGKTVRGLGMLVMTECGGMGVLVECSCVVRLCVLYGC